MILAATIFLRSVLSIDLNLAARYFQEASWASQDDAGALWGAKLYGPTLFVDPQTGDIVANQADQKGALTSAGTVFVGKVPLSFAAANTAMDWNGVKWSVIMWPLPERPVDRARLIMHESWHRIQSDIGLPPAITHNEHLDSKEGRIWLLMEYRALAKALPAWGDERKTALSDALTFRTYRRSLFPSAAENEDRMEVHEGMAEYTGICCSGRTNSEGRYYMAGRLKLNSLKPSLTYAFAYETGPAYGLLLDQYDEHWRKGLNPKSSLSELLAAAAHIAVGKVDRAEAIKRAQAYDGNSLIKQETKRDEERTKQLKEFRQTLIEGPRLHLPSTGNFTFDPNAVYPIPPTGTVYLGSKLSEEWGVLETTGPVLIDSQYKNSWVQAATGTDPSKGMTWKLTLNPGWKLVHGSRKGDWEVAKG
ncbi:MAG: hypothetical protein JST51_04760 [Armatimonadetes bacterium]|nr:hypothetical protein [Armatimonadota bacterium]